MSSAGDAPTIEIEDDDGAAAASPIARDAAAEAATAATGDATAIEIEDDDDDDDNFGDADADDDDDEAFDEVALMTPSATNGGALAAAASAGDNADLDDVPMAEPSTTQEADGDTFNGVITGDTEMVDADTGAANGAHAGEDEAPADLTPASAASASTTSASGAPKLKGKVSLSKRLEQLDEVELLLSRALKQASLAVRALHPGAKLSVAKLGRLAGDDAESAARGGGIEAAPGCGAQDDGDDDDDLDDLDDEEADNNNEDDEDPSARTSRERQRAARQFKSCAGLYFELVEAATVGLRRSIRALESEEVPVQPLAPVYGVSYTTAARRPARSAAPGAAAAGAMTDAAALGDDALGRNSTAAVSAEKWDAVFATATPTALGHILPAGPRDIRQAALAALAKDAADYAAAARAGETTLTTTTTIGRSGIKPESANGHANGDVTITDSDIGTSSRGTDAMDVADDTHVKSEPDGEDIAA